MSIQYIYVSIINYIYRITKKINSKILKSLLFLDLFLLSYYYLSRITNLPYFFNDYEVWVFTFQLLLLIPFSIDKEVKKVKINLFIEIPYFVLAVGMLVINKIKGISNLYSSTAIQLLIVYPMLVIIYKNKNEGKNNLLKYFSISNICICFLYYVYCFFAASKGELIFNESGCYLATAINQNPLSCIELTFLFSSIYLMYKYSEKKYLYIFSSLSFSISVLTILMTRSRAGLLSLVFCILAAIVFVIKLLINKKRIKLCKFIIIFSLLLCVNFSNNLLVKMNNANIGTSDIESNSFVVTKDSLTTVNYDLKETIIKLIERFSNNYSIRINVWKIYIKNIKAFGYGKRAEASLFVEDLNGKFYEPHNSIIEIYFYFGYMTGTSYLIIFAYSIFCGFKKLLNFKDFSSESLLLICIIGCYAIVSMVDIATLPIKRPFSFLYYLALFLL